MGYTLTVEDLDAIVVVPEPFTGNHWLRYMAAYREQPEDHRLARMFRGALAVMERAECVIDGTTYDLLALGMDAPLQAVLAVGFAVDQHVVSKFVVPKALSSAPSTPRKTTA